MSQQAATSPASEPEIPLTIAAGKFEELHRWSNSQVVLWLIQNDLKQFVPAFVVNNVVGNSLLKMPNEPQNQLEEICNVGEVPKMSSGQILGMKRQVAQLARHFKSIRPDVELLGEETDPDPPPDETPKTNDRKAMRENGWNFDREFSEWQRYHRTFVERVINQHVRGRLVRFKDTCTLLVLAISTTSTVFTSTSAGIIGSSNAVGKHNEVAIWIANNSSFILVVLSACTTLIAGFVQAQSAFWKSMDKDGRMHETYYHKLEQFYRNQLEIHPRDRMNYNEFLKQRQGLEGEFRELPELNMPPHLKTQAVERIRAYGTSEWARAFVWLGGRMRWPTEPEIVEMMLMDFSGHKLGEHTDPLFYDFDNKEKYMNYRKTVRKQKDDYFRKYGLKDEDLVTSFCPQLCFYLSCFGCFGLFTAICKPVQALWCCDCCKEEEPAAPVRVRTQTLAEPSRNPIAETRTRNITVMLKKAVKRGTGAPVDQQSTPANDSARESGHGSGHTSAQGSREGDACASSESATGAKISDQV